MVDSLLHKPEAFSALLSFVASLLAAVWALELYQLLRTGAIGKSWRVFIVAALIFMIHEVVHIVRIFGDFDEREFLGLYGATKLLFISLFAWGLYIQRHVFFSPHIFRSVLDKDKTHVSASQSESETRDDSPSKEVIGAKANSGSDA